MAKKATKTEAVTETTATTNQPASATKSAVPMPSQEELDRAKAIMQAARANQPKRSSYGNNVILKSMDNLDKLPKQARGILRCLQDHKSKMTVAELVAALTPPEGQTEGKYIDTRQGGMRIFTFYRKLLIERGHIDIIA